MFVMRKLLAALGLAIGMIASINSAQAQFPTKTVRIIVPYPAGGEGDSSARAVAARLSEKWKHSVVVENRPGASTIIGTQAVVNSPADGYTLLLTSFGFTTVQFRQQPLPYDVKALDPLFLVATAPLVLYVNQGLPIKSVDELVSYAKAKPGALLFSSAGIASSPHIGAELFAAQNGFEITHVPYKGTSPALADLIGGHVNAMWGAPSLMPHVVSGKLRALAVANTKRLTNVPDLATASELGYPNFLAASWFGMFLPAAVPSDVRNKIYADITEISAREDLKANLLKIGLEPANLTREQFADFLEGEKTKWGGVIKARNINIE